MGKNMLIVFIISMAVGLTLTGCGGGPPSAERGKIIFEQRCASCHLTTTRRMEGPGLAGFMKRNEFMVLPNGRAPNSAGVQEFLIQGSTKHTPEQMPENELKDLIEYLKSL
ncbi:MAG: cytochrome c [Chloroflexi bacterium]|nr:cytochrome c [Chloroflexota bacterium]